MKKLLIGAALVCCVMLLGGCEMQMPNPLVGTYALRADSVGADDYHLAALCMRNDGTFTYEEVVTGSSATVKVTGTYTLWLDFFDFLAADGSLYLTLDVIPDGIQNFYLSKGVNPFLFNWKCDKNAGPKSLTLIKDTQKPSKNLQLEYIGSVDHLPKGGVQ